MTDAHYLTLARIFLSPLFVILYLYHEAMGISLVLLPFLLIGIVVLSELSDVFDGIIARRKNQVTELGKLIDPMADSIFRVSVFLTFTQGIIQLPLFFVLVIFYRDSIISTLRTVCALKGVTLGARLSGKIKAVMHAVAIFFILGLLTLFSFKLIDLVTLRQISNYGIVVCAIYTLFTGIEYIVANRSYIFKALT